MADKNYQLIGEDDHVFKLRHPDGSEFQVAKHAVGQEVHRRIKSLEPAKMADGGKVEDPGPNPFTETGENPTEPIAPAYESAASPQYTNPNVPNASDALAAPTVDANLPAAPSPAPASAGVPPANSDQIAGQQGPAAPAGIEPQAQGPYGEFLKQQLEANKGITEAQKNLYSQNANALKEAVNKQAEYDRSFNDELKTNTDDHAKLLDAIKNQQIDPTRLFHQPGITGTLSNIGAAISVALSGIGSGLTGRPNMAMEVIQKNIDRDIEAQKIDLGKKQSLLSENLRKYGNIRDAQRATSAQLWTGVRGMMEARANQSQSQQAVQQGQLRGAEIGMNVAKMNQELATNVANAQSLGYGGQTGGLEASKIPYGLISNPQFQEKVVPIGDRVYQAHDKDQAKDLNKMEAIYRPIVSDIQSLKDLAQKGVLTSPEGRAQAEAIQGRLAMAVNEFNGYKRFTDVDDKIIAKQFNDPASIAGIIKGEGATNDTLAALKTKLESERKQALPGYKVLNFKPGL